MHKPTPVMASAPIAACLFEALEHRADLRDRFPEALFGDGLLDAVRIAPAESVRAAEIFGSAKIDTREEALRHRRLEYTAHRAARRELANWAFIPPLAFAAPFERS